MTIQVRSATADDLDALIRLNGQIQKLHADLYPEEFSENRSPGKVSKFFQKLIKSEEQILFVAEYENTVSGYIWCEIFQKRRTLFSASKNYLYVQHICVDNTLKRNGIGAALFREMEYSATENGISEIKLDTWSLNESAQAFFKTSGFEAYRINMKKKL